MNTTSSIDSLKAFLDQPRPSKTGDRTAISLFSGAGLSDMGYQLAGFRFVVQVELEADRARLGQANFPHSRWLVGDVRKLHREIVATYRATTSQPPDLLVATPPCQGMSSSNPSRGKRHTPAAKVQEERNRLVLELVPIARALRPRIIVAENVRQMLTLSVTYQNAERRALDVLNELLPGYTVFEGIVNVADYGIPQDRRRAIVVAIRKDEPWVRALGEQNLLPWPRPTHGEAPSDGRLPWITIRKWLEAMAYEPLDSSSPEAAIGTHPLHFVPHYDRDRYLQVAHIPPYSGRSAYQNETCPSCGHSPVPEGLALCSACGSIMRNRPYVIQDGTPRLVKGFASSYRRMHPDRPAATVTTNSSHIGSDFKIHPWENRVLSILECADLQTIPRFYDWSPALQAGRTYLIRNVVGEAFPTYFTYLHGLVLYSLLSGVPVPTIPLAKAQARLPDATLQSRRRTTELALKVH